ATTSSISGLCATPAGTIYSVVVTDANNCTAGPCNVTLTQPSQLSLHGALPISSKCNLACDGSATANPSGGTGPYTYLWNTGATTSSISDLCATPTETIYSVVVTDANNCTAGPCNVTLTQPSQLNLSCSGVHPSK